MENRDLQKAKKYFEMLENKIKYGYMGSFSKADIFYGKFHELTGYGSDKLLMLYILQNRLELLLDTAKKYTDNGSFYADYEKAIGNYLKKDRSGYEEFFRLINADQGDQAQTLLEGSSDDLARLYQGLLLLQKRIPDYKEREKLYSDIYKRVNDPEIRELMNISGKQEFISSSTIYVYFENKNDMINKLYLAVKQKMSQKMFQGIGESTPIKEGFERALRNFIDFVLNNKEYLLFIEQFTNSPLILNLCSEGSENLFKPMYELFEKGKRQNIIKQADTDMLINFCYPPIVQFAKEHYKGEFELNKENLENIIEMSWDAIKRK